MGIDVGKVDYMRKILSLTTVLCLSSVSYAQENVINVTGLLVQKPCEILSPEIDVDFGQMSPTDILENNMRKHDFEIRLDSCPRSIRTKFVGPSVSNNQILTTNASSDAYGVGIRLYKGDESPLVIGQDSTYTHEGNSSLHVINFKAEVVKLDSVQSTSDVKAGHFSATATYEVSYD